MTMLWILSIVLFLVTIWATFAVKSTFAKYNKVPIRSGLSGAEAAAAILRAAGVDGVGIKSVPGMLARQYDPQHRVVVLTEERLHSRTAGGVAVAGHEVGHGLQYAQGYAPMEMRPAMVPVANFASGM